MKTRYFAAVLAVFVGVTSTSTATTFHLLGKGGDATKTLRCEINPGVSDCSVELDTMNLNAESKPIQPKAKSGDNSKEERRQRERATVRGLTVVGAAIGGYSFGPPGAVVGGLYGALAGEAVNEAYEEIRPELKDTERALKKAGYDTEKAVKKAGKDLEKAVKKAGYDTERAVKKAGKDLEKAAKKIKKVIKL